MPICQICGDEHTEEEMIGDACISCASIMQDQDFECWGKKKMGELKYLASIINGDEEGEFLNLIQETLDKIGKKGENINDIKDNVIFVFYTIPAMTGERQDRTVIISFNIPSIKEDIKQSGGVYQERAKDIITHEIAHYVLKNYNKGPSEEIERQTDDYIEKEWDFNRAYTK